MKTFKEFIEARISEYGRFNTPGEHNEKIVWDAQHNAWYDEDGMPLDDSILHDFLNAADHTFNVKEFEVSIDFSANGFSYPANVGGRPEDSHDGDFDEDRTIHNIALYADGKPIPLSPIIKDKLEKHFGQRINKLPMQHAYH
jgi:hypothetical protein